MDTRHFSEAMTPFRTSQIDALGGIRTLRTSDWKTLGDVNIFPGQPLSKLYFVIPEEYVPPGNQRKLGQRIIDGTLDGELSRQATGKAAKRRQEWLGRSLLAFWLPTGSKRGNGLQAWSFRRRCNSLLWMLRLTIPSMTPDDGDFWPICCRIEQIASQQSRPPNVRYLT